MESKRLIEIKIPRQPSNSKIRRLAGITRSYYAAFFVTFGFPGFATLDLSMTSLEPDLSRHLSCLDGSV